MTTGKKFKKFKDKDFILSRSRVRLSTGEILRILREKNELSQIALAEATGLAQATISSLENNRISLGVERSKTLARVLKVHPAVLVFPDWEQEAS